MTDISKCDGVNCELKLTCWRFTAPASYRQSWFAPENRGLDCEMYWEVGRDGRNETGEN